MDENVWVWRSITSAFIRIHGDFFTKRCVKLVVSTLEWGNSSRPRGLQQPACIERYSHDSNIKVLHLADILRSIRSYLFQAQLQNRPLKFNNFPQHPSQNHFEQLDCPKPDMYLNLDSLLLIATILTSASAAPAPPATGGLKVNPCSPATAERKKLFTSKGAPPECMQPRNLSHEIISLNMLC